MVGSLMAPHLVEWYTDIYTNVYGADNTYSEIVQQFNTYLKQMVNGTVFTVFSGVVMSIGIILLLFYFFSDLTEKAAVNQLSMLQMGKSVCVAVGALFVIFHTKQIFIFMLTFVESLNETLTVATSGYADVTAFLENDTVQTLLSRCVSKYFGLAAIIGYTLTALLLMLISLVARIYVTYYSATRILQLFIYYIFAPVGMADIFENGPGGTINRNSSGFLYLKKMFAIMLQIVVITVTCQTFTLISSQVQSGYFEDQGDPSLHIGIGFIDDFFLNVKMKSSATYPLRNFEYTDHKAGVLETGWNGLNKVREALTAAAKKAVEALGPPGSGGGGGGGGGGGAIPDEDDLAGPVESLQPDEKYPITDVVNLDGSVADASKANDIKHNSKYRMTVESTEVFFDWCTGSDGSKTVLFIILMVTKALMVGSSAKLCDYITGVSV